MKEFFEFRIPESRARQHLPPEVGRSKGIARSVEVTPTEPLFERIGRAERTLRAQGKAFFTAWIAHRRYSSEEIAAAELLRVSARKTFEPAGEECGTRYDDARGCPVCGGGAPQVSPLYLEGLRIPDGQDWCSTIAGEIVVSQRLVEVAKEARLQGAVFEPVRLVDRDGRSSRTHCQVIIDAGRAVDLHESTLVGENPFDEESEGACARGDVVGMSLISEARVRRRSYAGDDLVQTNELVGVRSGLLRPRPVVFLSPKAWATFGKASLRGFSVEVADLR